MNGAGGCGGGGAFLIMSNDVICGYKSYSIYSRPSLQLSSSSSAIITPPFFPTRARPRKMISIQNHKKVEREREMHRYFFGIEKMEGGGSVI
jgi:hypothetical protein